MTTGFSYLKNLFQQLTKIPETGVTIKERLLCIVKDPQIGSEHFGLALAENLSRALREQGKEPTAQQESLLRGVSKRILDGSDSVYG